MSAYRVQHTVDIVALIERVRDLRDRRAIAEAACKVPTDALSALAEEVACEPRRVVMVPSENTPGYAISYGAYQAPDGWRIIIGAQKGDFELTPLGERLRAADAAWRVTALAYGDLDREYKAAVKEAMES